MRRATPVQVQRYRSAVYLAVSGGASRLAAIHQEACRQCEALSGNKTATDRALQWWRKRGTFEYSEETGWRVIEPEGAAVVLS